jgi:quercetin dioxygenase-like cupin family protein
MSHTATGDIVMSNSVIHGTARAPWARRLTAAGGLAILGAVGLLAGAAASAQDAAKVDAKHYKVVFENDQVRVLRITYGPHEKGIMHSHPAGVVVFLNDTKGKFTMPGGKTQEVSAKAGTVQWSEPTTHQPENIGDKEFEVIQVELKAKPAAAK